MLIECVMLSTARATAEPLTDCNSRCHETETATQGVNRRQPRQKQRQSSLQTANRNSRNTKRRAAAPRRQPATAAEKATAKPLLDCKSRYQGHKQESRRPKASTGDSRGKSNSGAPYNRLPITMSQTHKGEWAPQGVKR